VRRVRGIIGAFVAWVKWPRNDRLALGIFLGTLLAVVVAVVTLYFIVSSGSSERKAPVVGISAVTYSGPKPPQIVSVSGTATDLPAGDEVYALARPLQGRVWFHGSAVPVHPNGSWKARIRIDPPTTAQINVVAVDVKGEEQEAAAAAPSATSTHGSGANAAPLLGSARGHAGSSSAPEASSESEARTESQPVPVGETLSEALSSLSEYGPHAAGVRVVSSTHLAKPAG
jgi:hypothetical protein